MSEAVTFRRGWFRRSVLWLVIAAGWVTAAALVLWLLAIGLEPGWSFGKALNALILAGAAVRLPLTILALQRWNRNFAANHLVIDDAGIRGRLGARTVDVGWPEISGILRGRGQGVYVLSTRGGPIGFTALDIPAPKRAARIIAARLGHNGF